MPNSTGARSFCGGAHRAARILCRQSCAAGTPRTAWQTLSSSCAGSRVLWAHRGRHGGRYRGHEEAGALVPALRGRGAAARDGTHSPLHARLRRGASLTCCCLPACLSPSARCMPTTSFCHKRTFAAAFVLGVPFVWPNEAFSSGHAPLRLVRRPACLLPSALRRFCFSGTSTPATAVCVLPCPDAPLSLPLSSSGCQYSPVAQLCWCHGGTVCGHTTASPH